MTVLLGLLGGAGCDGAKSGSSAPPTVSVPGPGATATASPKPAPEPAAARPSCMVPLGPEPARPEPPPGPDANCPEDPTGPPHLGRGKITFGNGTSVKVEFAVRPPDRQRGLMYRTAMPEDEGMLFVFQRPQVMRFWMRNTCIPLDMLFIDRAGFVVGIEENVPTMNDNTYGVRCRANYVLETNAGWARRHDIKPGETVKLEGL